MNLQIGRGVLARAAQYDLLFNTNVEHIVQTEHMPRQSAIITFSEGPIKIITNMDLDL